MQEVPIKNPVYLMLGASFGSAAKGTGLKALEFALSTCDSVDMYGFTVDPGYKEWYKVYLYLFFLAVYLLTMLLRVAVCLLTMFTFDSNLL